MLFAIAAVLLMVLWFLGLGSGCVLGGFINIFLMAALVVLIAGSLQDLRT